MKLSYTDYIDENDGYGVKSTQKDMLVMTPQNDPFGCDQAATRRDALWFSECWMRYIKAGGKLHLRGFHYVMVSQLHPVLMPDGSRYDNTQECWTKLQKAAKWARIHELVPCDSITDKHSPQFHTAYTACDLEIGSAYMSDSQYWIGSQLASLDMPSFPERPRLVLPERPEMTLHTHYVEIWSEKSGLDDVLIPLCNKRGITYVPCTGEATMTAVTRCVERALYIAAGRAIRILHLGDFDPAGENMTKSLARKIEYQLRWRESEYGETHDVQVDRLGLTVAQVKRWELPRTPIKESERRKAGFEQRYGTGAVELDALVALRPGALEQMVDERLEEFDNLDHDTRRELKSEWRDYKAEALETVTAAVEPHVEKLDAIKTKQAEMQAELKLQVEAALAAYNAGMGDLDLEFKDAWDAAVADGSAVVPEPPEIEMPESIAWDDPLMDASLSYMDQLVRYNEYKEFGC